MNKSYKILALSALLVVLPHLGVAAQQTTLAQTRAADQTKLQAIVQQARENLASRQKAEIDAGERALGAKNVSAKNAAPVVNTRINSQAFSNVAHNLMPLTPAQIHMLRYMLSRSRRAAAEAPGVPPRPTSDTVAVSLAPGATPPVIRLASGFITSLVFLDSTGAPWPIKAYDLGDPGSFNIQWNHKGNTLLVQSIARYKSGNLAVMLQGLDTPIMITLMPGQRVVDYRVDLNVPGLGPHPNPIATGLPSSASPVLLNVLDGVPPANSKALNVEGGQAQIWQVGDVYYLRTQMTLLSPSWVSRMNSVDGMHAYTLPRTPDILVSRRGQIIQLAIQGAA